jgi:hypothetical protein
MALPLDDLKSFSLTIPLSRRPPLVGSHQAGIADHVGGEDCREPAVDALVSHD